MTLKFFLSLISILLLNGCQQHIAEDEKQHNAQESDLILHVASPDWRDQIIYFLMTDRFNDGDPSNNDQGAGEYNPHLESHYSGGDIQGVIDELDYIQNMGITSVWMTPIVANQWWSTPSNYGGYHGYWATDFSAVDKHMGSIDTYKALSDSLHKRNMYLIQDIVVNHTGNFFNYKNGHLGYDENDTAKNFYLMEQPGSAQVAPTQPPFNMIDRHNPAHVKAGIYNWTPSITDYQNVEHQFTYQLSSLADLNTQNPTVVNRFKKIYGDWIKNTGVDAMRIDTVRYVEQEFFHHFMHDEDGIHATAKQTGRDNFLAFGEVFDTSKPFENDAEKRIANYEGTSNKPALAANISFPLHHELKTVFGQGLPTAHLAYRITQHMAIYGDPYITPTFIDNHDMARFLSSGDVNGLKQALATIFTIPGIPVIYQGTAQAMTESRQAMFEGGFEATKDYFDQQAPLYLFIQKLAKLRTSDKLFTRGDIKMIASNENGPGLFAYTRSYKDRNVLVMYNTSRNPILVNRIKVANSAAKLNSLLGESVDMALNASGQLTTELTGKSIIIAEIKPMLAPGFNSKKALELPKISTKITKDAFNSDLVIQGYSTVKNSEILLVKNTRIDTAKSIKTDKNGYWQYNYPVVNLGIEHVSLVAYQPAQAIASNPLAFVTQVDNAEFERSISDPINDDHGLTGHYLPPQHAQSIGQLDIVNAQVKTSGDTLSLTLTMRELTNNWMPSNGFDNVAFSIFFDLPNKKGKKVLPIINADIPNGWDWDLGHVIYGWGNTTFSSEQADANHQGLKFGVAPAAKVNDKEKTITLEYKGVDFDVNHWRKSKIYITTWDISGEGVYRNLQPQADDWSFGGGKASDAKILDSVIIEL